MKLSKAAIRQITEAATSIKGFARWFVGVTLRPYQIKAANALINSVFARDGETFVWIFSRQSGKDETIALTFLFLLLRFVDWSIEIVCAQPTFKPQSITAMERIKKRGQNFGKNFSRTAGYIFRLWVSRVSYFSAEPTANVVSATARLLVFNEAQDIDPAIADGRFNPMGANENATKLYSGTRWTEDTLLERELKIALQAEAKDGKQRVFMYDANEIRKHNPWYGKYVDKEVSLLGRQHPLIKSQYFNETINSQAGMFNAGRLALMQGDQPAQTEPVSGRLYAFLVDVAGMDEALLNLDGMGNPGRDSTALSIVEIDLSTLETLQRPTYRIVQRQAWQGQNHLSIFGKLKSFADTWKPQHIVIDATGVGEGLWAMLDKAYPARVIPIKFTQQTKSEIGYGYLAIIETGRLRDCAPSDETRLQYQKCQSEILPGPAHTMRWGVKDGTRGPGGELIHDDHIVTDSLTAELDKLEWSLPIPREIIHTQDPIKSMDKNY
jgi:hypothetical protein